MPSISAPPRQPGQQQQPSLFSLLASRPVRQQHVQRVNECIRLPASAQPVPVFIRACEDTVFAPTVAEDSGSAVRSRLVQVAADRCVDCRLCIYGEVVSTVELIHCQGTLLHVHGTADMITVDNCSDTRVRIVLAPQHIATAEAAPSLAPTFNSAWSIVTSGNVSTIVELATPLADYALVYAMPDQIVSRLEAAETVVARYEIPTATDTAEQEDGGRATHRYATRVRNGRFETKRVNLFGDAV
ncbi:hypothetical protein RI367_008014 [Sorochytrium milnesiophthora]